MVAHDLFLTATAKLAHVVLPGLSFYEKEGTFTNVTGRVQRLACQLELPLMEGNTEAVWNELARSVSAYAGITYESVGEFGTPLYGDRPKAED
ncbi:MAG: molybdopterin-dependent oxidoreductase [Candidatus Methylomirabilis sp.]|nr:molybdopterin-dependent oxidoreductase [Candidatus Methylomirabilis sp.]